MTEKTSSNIKKRMWTTDCHLSSHTILHSVIYPTSFVSTGQPYKNIQNCAKSSKNHTSWLSGNPKVWKISWWELTSPLDLPTMVSVQNMIRDDVWRAKTSNAACTHTGEEFIIHCNANCKTENIIYLLECANCGLQYIEETKQLSKRLNGHRSDANCKPDLPLSRHLRSTGHHDSFSKLKVTIIDP